MNDKYSYLYIYLFILALIYYIINNFTTNVLISIIIIIIISYFINLKINNDIANDKYEENKVINDLNKNLENVNTINLQNYNTGGKVPKEFKYLVKDDILIDIIDNIDFLKKFNKTLYVDILVTLDKLMKIYIYILSSIYSPIKYLSTFIDLKYSVIELLESIKLNVPIKSKYTIGFNLHEYVDKTILLFKLRTRKMLTILNNFSKYEKKIIFLEDTDYKSLVI
jgi:hypothetical protein